MDLIRPKVLVIDDSQYALHVMSMHLGEVADVYTVTGGIAAVDFLKQKKVDMILLDLEMPFMDGFQTLERLRKLEDCINVPVIVVTGVRDKDTVINSAIMGVDGYLIKPVTKQAVQKKVLDVYRKRRVDKKEKKTVLLIDDDMASLRQTNYMLQDKYNVIMINAAKMALDYLLKHVPDVIVLDYQMPLFSGSSMMSIIRSSSPGSDIPIIILSGVLSRESLQECYQYNPSACLAKPVSKEALETAIAQALEK
jgi:CheY-like chemotaxis protein